MTRNEDLHGNVGTDSNLYSRRCWWEVEGHKPSEAVVAAVAEATGRDPEHLRPLFEVVDPDALDAVFEGNAARSGESVNGYVSFEFEWCEVRVGAGGRTVVVPPEDGDH